MFYRGQNMGYFGGTYESAKTDDRKEFNRMLSFVKRSKNITYVIVYSYERFSRSGINGAQIADIAKKLEGIKKGETISFDNFSFMVSQSGFEPETASLEGRCSIQLSYWPFIVMQI